MSRSSAAVEETIGIETAGNSASLELQGRDTVTIHITEDAAADYVIDGRIRGGTWKQDLGPTYSGGGPHADTFDIAVEEIRVRCSTGTATAGDSATITVFGGG